MDSLEIVRAIRDLNTHDWFDYLTGIGSLMISVVALFVAIKINNSLSLKRQILEKQLETVYKLVESLQNTTFCFAIKGYWEEMPKTIAFGFETRFFEMDFEEKDHRLYKALLINKPMLYSWEAQREMDFIKYSDNPYTPGSIAKAIDKFKSYPGPLINDEFDNYDKIVALVSYGIHTNKNLERNNKEQLYRSDYEVFKDFLSFQKVCINLSKEITVWLKKHNAAFLNLR